MSSKLNLICGNVKLSNVVWTYCEIVHALLLPIKIINYYQNKITLKLAKKQKHPLSWPPSLT